MDWMDCSMVARYSFEDGWSDLRMNIDCYVKVPGSSSALCEVEAVYRLTLN